MLRRIRGVSYWSKEKMPFQSFFMLITVHFFALASSYRAWLKVPTLVSSNPSARTDSGYSY
jgi:hypothetical protein